MPAAPQRRIPMLLTLALAALIAAVSFNVNSAEAAAENRTDLRLLPTAEKRLGAKSVRLISTGLARGRGRAIKLPTLGGRVGDNNARLTQGGGIRIRVRAPRGQTRSLLINRLQLRLGRRSVMTGRVPRAKAGRPLFFLRHGPRALELSVEGKTARLRNARLVPTPQARRIFRQKLGLKVRALPLGRITLSADLTKFDLPEIEPPPLKPLPPEPEKLARPASAVDVTSAQITWCVRASWVRYIGNGAVSNGASHESPFVVNEADLWKVCDQKRAKVSSGPTAYRYFFTFKEGWYDAASGKAALYFTGKVRFRYPLRGIDLDFNDPEVEINGTDSRTIFKIEGRDDTEIGAHRTVFTTNGDPAPQLNTSNPSAIRSGEMPGFLATGTSAGVFSDFYIPPEHDFGWVSVEFKP